MPGDTTKALVTRVRTNIGEASAGFWTGDTSTDGNIQTYLDNAQKFIIDIRVAMLLPFKDKNKFRNDPILNPIITSSSVAWDVSANTIALPTNRFVFYAELLKSSTGASLPMTMLGYEEALTRRNNSYMGHSTNETDGTGQVFCYIATKLYTSYPTGTHSTYYDKVTVYYITEPTAVSNSVDPVLDANCWEGLVQYACYMALMKKKDERAMVHFKNFWEWVSK
jgi:hypothetical protein